jgi:hypothetical protein
VVAGARQYARACADVGDGGEVWEDGDGGNGRVQPRVGRCAQVSSTYCVHASLDAGAIHICVFSLFACASARVRMCVEEICTPQTLQVSVHAPARKSSRLHLPGLALSLSARSLVCISARSLSVSLSVSVSMSVSVLVSVPVSLFAYASVSVSVSVSVSAYTYIDNQCGLQAGSRTLCICI